MRWKAKAEPEIGDKKTQARFAFAPVRTDDGYTVWLEWYSVCLRYETRTVATKAGPMNKTGWFDYKTELYKSQWGYEGYD